MNRYGRKPGGELPVQCFIGLFPEAFPDIFPLRELNKREQ